MRKFYFFLAILLTAMTVQAKGSGIPSEIFKNGKVKYEKSTNTLILEDGFKYSLGKGLVVFETGKDLRLLLKGNAEFKAALVFKDNLIIEASQPAVLAVTSNISGSAIECPNLTVKENVDLQLLSRNSQEGMHALKCHGTLNVQKALFRAETTTANLSVKVKELSLDKAIMEKPKGGIVNDQWGGICYGDSLPAKIVRIKPEVKK
ncbi:MAG: hypothetical protein IJQ18_03515 [Paludibacteraceae bacterium]|nr:hypothetical protein [Paludibacteraceae bacterium]